MRSILRIADDTLDPLFRDGEPCDPEIVNLTDAQPCPADGHLCDRQPAYGEGAKRDRPHCESAYRYGADGDGSSCRTAGMRRADAIGT
jgi:hypothetical protein